MPNNAYRQNSVSLPSIDWEFEIIPCFKFVKIRKFYEIFKILKNSFYRITSNGKVFEFEYCDSDTGEDNEAAGDS